MAKQNKFLQELLEGIGKPELAGYDFDTFPEKGTPNYPEDLIMDHQFADNIDDIKQLITTDKGNWFAIDAGTIAIIKYGTDQDVGIIIKSESAEPILLRKENAVGKELFATYLYDTIAYYYNQWGSSISLRLITFTPISKDEQLDTFIPNNDVYDRAQAMLDLISTFEVGFDITDVNDRNNMPDEGYDLYVGGTIPSSTTEIVKNSRGENKMINWSDQGDNTMVHPNVLVTWNSAGSKSTAAGKYQFLYSTWSEVSKDVVNIDNAPMSKENQDKFTLRNILKKTTGYGIAARDSEGNPTQLQYVFNMEKKIRLLNEGAMLELIQSLASEWASIPGYWNQYHKDINTIYDKYAAILNYNIKNHRSLNTDVRDYLTTLLTNNLIV